MTPSNTSKIIRPRWPRRSRRRKSDQILPPHVQVAEQMGLLDPSNVELFAFIRKIMAKRQTLDLEST